MRYIFKKYLLKSLIMIAALFILMTTYKAYFYKSDHNVESVRIVQHEEEISDSKYIISEKMILGKLQSKSQIVSLEQSFTKTDTNVDDSWLGERKTDLNLKGSYKLGLNTSDINILHIDNENGIVYIKLDKPDLISLEIPFNNVEIEKTSGWLRMALTEDEEKSFYKSVHKNIKKEILSDKEILTQANLNNQRVIKELLINLPGVNSIIFSEEDMK